MLTREDKKYIVELVRKETPTILKEINFDPLVKEVGHSYCDRYEDECVKMLKKYSSDFTDPTEVRSLDDIKYKDHYINIKFGYKKNGHPNLCSGNKLFDYLHQDIIDSYYVLSVDANGPEYQFYDVYEYITLDCFTYNAGPQQFMIKESKIKEEYEFDKKFPPLDKMMILERICNEMEKSAHDTYKLRMKKIGDKRKKLNGYKKSSTLF